MEGVQTCIDTIPQNGGMKPFRNDLREFDWKTGMTKTKECKKEENASKFLRFHTHKAGKRAAMQNTRRRAKLYFVCVYTPVCTLGWWREVM
jgi:hypothetical protein